MSTPQPNPTIDIKRGKDALIYFHNEALKYPQNYRLRFEELLSHLDAKYHGQLVENLGWAINQVGMSEGQVEDGMKALAQKGEGRLPAMSGSYFQALIEPARSFSFSEAANEVLKGSARDIAVGLAETGKAVVSAGKGLLNIAPLALLGGVLLFAYFKGKTA